MANILDVSNVETASYMFSGCSQLTSFTAPAFTTVCNIAGLFKECTNLVSVDLSAIDTTYRAGYTRYMEYLFYNCKSLASINFDFNIRDDCVSGEYMFYGCESLTILDLRNFKPSLVDNYSGLSYMFAYCTNLTTIYALNWGPSYYYCMNVDNSSSMFVGCPSLYSQTSGVGYNEASVDGDMCNWKTGYFTAPN